MIEHREHTGFRRRAAIVLAAALVFNPVLTVARPADAAGAATASLDVISEPAGANVYVDGKLAGQTPLQVSALEPGDHRVRVSKDGYLENARIVTVSAADTKVVNVKLTPHNGSNANTMEQVSGGGGGGGSKKWLWIGLAGGGAAAATLLLLPKNKPPVAGSITTSPTATGMAGVTTFTFTSTASDPDGDALTYSWNFGDGSTGSGAAPTKVFSSAGTFNVTVSVSDGKESATAPGVTVVVGPNLTGTWTGGRDPFSGCALTMSLTQSSGTLSGSVAFVSGCTGGVTLASGSATPLTHPSAIVLTSQTYNHTIGNDVYQGLVMRFTGTTEASGASMTGTMTISQASTGGSVSGSTTFRK